MTAQGQRRLDFDPPPDPRVRNAVFGRFAWPAGPRHWTACPGEVTSQVSLDVSPAPSAPESVPASSLGLVGLLVLRLRDCPVAAGGRRAERRRRTRRAAGHHLLYGVGAGALEPCGCTSDPLGDVARMTGVVRRAGPAAARAAGRRGQPHLSGRRGAGTRLAEGADLRAAFLATELARLPLGGVGSGRGRPGPRAGAGASRAAGGQRDGGAGVVAPSRLREVGGIRIGILGLADPALARRFGWRGGGPRGGRAAGRPRDLRARAPSW